MEKFKVEEGTVQETLMMPLYGRVYCEEHFPNTLPNKAAKEMKERIGNLVGDYLAKYLYAGTFHSIFLRFLKGNAELLGYPKTFTVYDKSDSLTLIKRCIKELELDDKIYKPNEIKHDIKLKYGVDISYDKAWRAREHALNSIRGTAEQSFSQLPSYFAMLEAMNPRSVTRIATDDNQCFKYCY